ncbi:MAG: PEP-CTERM sorting domain-containing protein [Sulfuriferula multivorans]|uniref:PEP-CTERM sorting domain-containing protein n=1 Tax=Sulfuriferula multivorans TaxID=1559896 RepID=A0A7C9P6R5_9PROT|nr:PEP-CTERM sorting domain-containing protein [Sulfuriferula multivorans]
MKSTITKVAAVAILAASATAAQAVALNNGDVLTITSGTTTSSASFGGTGSFFGMDTNANFKISNAEATAILGGTGYTIGQATPTAATSAIDSWFFNSGWGENYVKGTPITGSTTAGLNMTGMTVFWGGDDIPMGFTAWQSSTTNPTNANIMSNLGQTYTDSTANFNWSGVYGDAYTLDYTAIVPVGAPFAGTKYYLHLEGNVVAAVPEASTYGMMLAGLGLVGFAVRRRKLVA